MKICILCKQEKPFTEFFRRTGKRFENARKESSQYSSYCKICNKLERVKHNRRNKIEGVKLLGGKCSRCGYNKCVAALDFHHTDEKLKKIGFNNLKNRKLEYFLSEIAKQKCVLLCANCHREEHWDDLNKP